MPKVLCLLLLLPSLSSAQECVVLLHGLARTSHAMQPLADYLSQRGYVSVNVDYPSRELPIEQLAETAISQGIQQCQAQKASPINFVTHSLGGILVRQYHKTHAPSELKRVVMLAPPNQGSHVVDKLKHFPPFYWLNGESGQQLGTDKDSLPQRLGAVNFKLGVIAGTRSINWLLSLLLPNPDDGKVSLSHTQIDGMCAFLSLPVTHTFIMHDSQVWVETLHFLQHGHFRDKTAVHNPCSQF